MFKTFDPYKDIKNQTTPVNEVIVFGGTVFTGVLSSQENIKKYTQWTSGTISGGYYQSMFSTNYTSGSAVEL